MGNTVVAATVITILTFAAMWVWLVVWEHISEHLYWRKVRRYNDRPDFGFPEYHTDTNQEGH